MYSKRQFTETEMQQATLKHPLKGQKVNPPCVTCFEYGTRCERTHIYRTEHFFSPKSFKHTFVIIRLYFALRECLILALSSTGDVQTWDYAAARSLSLESVWRLRLHSTQWDRRRFDLFCRTSVDNWVQHATASWEAGDLQQVNVAYSWCFEIYRRNLQSWSMRSKNVKM